MPLERVFIDSNVLVSGIAFRGNEHALIGLALDGTIVPVISEAVLRETCRVLEAKFPAIASRLPRLLSLLEYELISDLEPSSVTKAAKVVRDPGDVEILAAILTARPDSAITGDKDLLTDEVRAIAPTCRCADYLREREQQ